MFLQSGRLRTHNVLDHVIQTRAEAPTCDHGCCHLQTNPMYPAQDVKGEHRSHRSNRAAAAAARGGHGL